MPLRAVARQMAPSMPREFSCRLWEARGSDSSSQGDVATRRECMDWALGKATCSGFALLRTLGLAIPWLFPEGMFGKAVPGSAWGWVLT